jgi:hypothetical protein
MSSFAYGDQLGRFSWMTAQMTAARSLAMESPRHTDVGVFLGY